MMEWSSWPLLHHPTDGMSEVRDYYPSMHGRRLLLMWEEKRFNYCEDFIRILVDDSIGRVVQCTLVWVFCTRLCFAALFVWRFHMTVWSGEGRVDCYLPAFLHGVKWSYSHTFFDLFYFKYFVWWSSVSSSVRSSTSTHGRAWHGLAGVYLCMLIL